MFLYSVYTKNTTGFYFLTALCVEFEDAEAMLDRYSNGYIASAGAVVKLKAFGEP